MRGVQAAPGHKIKIGSYDAHVTRIGCETRGAQPPIVEYRTAKALRVYDDPQEGAIVGVQGIFVEGSWIRIAAQPLSAGKHKRWLGMQLFRVGAVASGSSLLSSALSFLSQGIPFPRLGDVRVPYAEVASDLVGTFIQYDVNSVVWGEWAGNPGIVEEERLYGATTTSIKVTLIGHFD
jgi:hypothetical protein